MTQAADASTSASTSITWSDNLLLGFPRIDDEHREFVELLQALQQAPDAEFAGRLERFAEHARAHFAAEDAWMRDTDFPAGQCHIDEHAAVLRSVDDVSALVAQGNVAEGRRLADALADWFPPHAQHLDSALSHWMCKRELGGKPIVLRRNVAVSGLPEDR
jgi:hemerythrin